MPHRSHDFSELCSECDREAEAPCVRCAKIFCDGHRPRGDRRCEACERTYAERLDALGDDGGSPFSPLLIIATGIGAAAGFFVGQVTAAVAVIGIGLIGTLVSLAGEHADSKNPKLLAHRHEVRQLRTDFLAERSRLVGPGDET